MLKKSLWLVALIVLGCGEEKSQDTPSDGDNGGKVTKDASVKDARSGSNTNEDEDDASAMGGRGDQDAGTERPIDEPMVIDDAGSIAIPTADGGTVVITPGKDGGAQLSGMGSCCSAHDTPGCNNADLMVCVCELNRECCTKAWTIGCTFIVKQKYCQPAVQECLCSDDWSGLGCCKQTTNDMICQTTAEKKCGAIPGCF